MRSDSETVQRRLAASLQPACAGEDPRRVRTAAWLVAGLLLEQDARLSRIALAMAEPASQVARGRRLRRWLDGPFDVHACYRVLVRPLRWCDAHGWRYRVRAKQGLRVQLPDGTCRAVRDFRSMPGALRVLDTVKVTGHRYGPAGLLLC